MGKLSKTHFANLGVTSFCVSCPLCHHANDDVDIFEDENIIIYAEEEFRTIECEGCGEELTVLAMQIFETDISDPSEAAQAIAKREAFTHPKRVRKLELALWRLTSALYAESQGNSRIWSDRIKKELQRGRSLVHDRDKEFGQITDNSAAHPPLYRFYKA